MKKTQPINSIKQFFGNVNLSHYPNNIEILCNKSLTEPCSRDISKYQDYRTRWEQNPEKFLVEPFPLHIDIELSNICNLRCPMCYREFYQKKRKKEFLDYNLFMKIVDECTSEKLPSIKLVGGGEVFLYPDIYHALDYLSTKNFLDIRVNTNGALLTQNLAEKIVDSTLTYIIFSVDGAKKETYNSIRVGADFDEVVSNIRYLARIRNDKGKGKPLLKVQMVCSAKTKYEVIDFIDMWSPIVDVIGLIRYRNPLGENQDLWRLSLKPEESKPCRQLWQRMTVLSSGDILMCCGDFNAHVVLGNIKNNSIRELWLSKKLAEIRNMHRTGRLEHLPSCRTCEINKKGKGDAGWEWLVDLIGKR